MHQTGNTPGGGDTAHDYDRGAGAQTPPARESSDESSEEESEHEHDDEDVEETSADDHSSSRLNVTSTEGGPDASVTTDMVTKTTSPLLTLDQASAFQATGVIPAGKAAGQGGQISCSRSILRSACTFSGWSYSTCRNSGDG